MSGRARVPLGTAPRTEGTAMTELHDVARHAPRGTSHAERRKPESLPEPATAAGLT